MTSSWYQESFGESYIALYPHRDQTEANNDIADVCRFFNINKSAQILDLCCGGGRHLKAFRTLGYEHLTGLDLSGFLLSQAKTLLGDDTPLINGDMRKIPVDLSFDNIVSLFTSFGYFDDDHENTSVIDGVYKRLNRQGRYIVDTINPAFLRANLVGSETKDLADKQLVINRHITIDGKRIEKETLVSSKHDDTTERFFESVRLYNADEFNTMFEQAGFKEIKHYGSISGAAYEQTSPRLITTGIKS